MNEHYPLDYTGFGPTGIGNAPTAQERRMQAMNRFHTNRMGQATQYYDPYTIGAAAAARRMVHGNAASPDAMRRSLFETAGGQAALDLATIGRRTGYLGYGDPVNYSANISQGIAGGGFRTSMGGMAGGSRFVGSPGMTSGHGHVAERVAANFARGMMTDLYGRGAPNPSKMYGFDMEETSQIFSTLARRGVIGHAAHVEMGANVETRLAAARESAMHPSVRAGLAKIKLKGASETEKMAHLEELIGSSDNDLMKKELKAIHSSSDAIVVNDRERKRVSELVKSVTKGVAALSDMYGELSAPELHQKLEAISGMRITNQAQAKRAHQMVEGLRGAAMINDMDPGALFRVSDDMQAMLQGRVANTFGFDERTTTLGSGVTAAIHNTALRNSLIEARVMQNNVKSMRHNLRGTDVQVADPMTALEIYQDKVSGSMEFSQLYKAVTMTQGGLGSLTGKHRKDASALLNRFKNTSDASERMQIEQQLQAIWSDAASQDGTRRSFQNVFDSGTGKHSFGNAYSNYQNATEMESMRRMTRDADQLNGFIIGNLRNAGVADADAVGKQMIKLGAGNLNELYGISTAGKANARKRQKDILIDSGLSSADADKYLDNFFDASGKAKNEGAIHQALVDMQRAGREGGVGAGDSQRMAKMRLDAMDSGGLRRRIKPGEGDITLKNIGRALLDGQFTGINDAETATLALEALGDANIKMKGKIDGKEVDLVQKAATNINFLNGLTPEGLKKLDAVHGGSLGLYKKMIDPKTGQAFKDRAALIAATKSNPKMVEAVINTLKNDKDYAHLNLSGGPSAMNAIHQEALAAVYKGDIDGIMKGVKGAAEVSKALGLDDEETRWLMEDVGRGDGANGSYFTPTAITDLDAQGLFGTGTDKTNMMGQGSARMLKLGAYMKKATPKQMAAIAAMDKDGHILDNMEEQLRLWEQKKGDDYESGDILVDMGKGNKDLDLGDAVKALKETIAAMKKAKAVEEGAQLVNEMRVTNVVVEGAFDPGEGK